MWGDIMMHVGGYYDACGGYQECIRGCLVHWEDTMSTSGNVQYIGDIMMHVGEQVDKIVSISIENPNVLNIPDVLMISPDVLNLP